MQARDVMTSPVVTVGPDAPLHQVCEALLAHRISGVLVVAPDGSVLGTVGDGDLLHRHEVDTDTQPHDRGWWKWLTQVDGAPAAYVKSHGAHARDVMSPHFATVSEETPAAEVATLLEQRHIRRVPVLRDGQLVGIVTRADLVRALAQCARGAGPAAAAGDDATILRQLARELARQSWWRDDLTVIAVEDGVVHYRGLYEHQSHRDAARVAAENVPGVRAVQDHRTLFSELQTMF